jgi:hypothetical protein
LSSRAALLASSIVYGVLIFVGTAGLGFVGLPAVVYAAGLFPIETEATGALSLVTLKAVPFLVSLSAAAAVSYEWLVGFTIARRAAIYLATVVLVWIAGAACAVFILG